MNGTIEPIETSPSPEGASRIEEKLVEEAVRDHSESLRRIARLPEANWMPMLSDELIRHIRRLHAILDGSRHP